MNTSKKQIQPNATQVDIHHHILPPVYVKALEETGMAGQFKAEKLHWLPQNSLDFMESNQIDKAVVSIPNPGTHFHEKEATCSLSRLCNEYAARMVADFSGKFLAFLSLPLPDMNGSLKELEYASDTLNLSGVILMSNVNGIYLGDPRFDELFSELNRRKMLVFIHPNRCLFGAEFNTLAEYPLDVTRAVANLMYHGVLERYRGIRYILAHLGGALPYLAVRIFSVTHTFAQGIKSETLNFNPLTWIPALLRRKALLKKMYFDITASISSETLHPLPEITTISNILMGTDFPLADPNDIWAEYRALDRIPFFNTEERSQIKGENAEYLLC